MQDDKVPKRQLMLVGIAVFLTGILLIVKPSSASFQVNKTINIMDAKVGDFRPSLKVNVYVGGILQNSTPTYPASSGHVFSSLTCDNDGSGNFNTTTWSASYSYPNRGLTTCNIYFLTKTLTINAYIDNVLSSTNPLSYPSNATYDYSSLSCNNGGNGTFNTGSWTATWNYPNAGITTCSIYFVTKTKIVSGDKITIIAGVINVDYDVNMIPVVYNSSGQTVKADETNKDSTYYWFDYCQKTSSGLYGYKASGCTFRWANAVLVKSTNRATYKSASPGTLITESDILAYFVYIPRYRYQLWNANNSTSAVQTINITFENKTTAPICGGNTCTTSRVYSTGTNSQWLTHPAFTFGTTQLNGIWVGKFEVSGYTDDTITYNCMITLVPPECDNANIIPVIKPNVYAIKRQTVSNKYITASKLKSNSMYGLSSSSIDAHMMKNMEWGAIAYLSQSIYGKRGNQGTEIWGNNFRRSTSPYQTLTGCSGNSLNATTVTTCTYTYPNSNGVEASTTGSIYGIYDMNGGLEEAVMGNMVASGQVAPGSINAGSSGFTTPYPASKYYDSYPYGTTFELATAFARGYLGDATKETMTCLTYSSCGWYGDISAFVFNTASWFYRGGGVGEPMSLKGVFAFFENSGAATNDSGLRSTLVVE